TSERGHVRATHRRLSVGIHSPGAGIEQLSADRETGLGWHAPVYGRLEPSTTLRISRRGHEPLWVATAIDLRMDRPIERVDPVPVWSAAGSLDHSLALRIVRADTVDTFVIAEGRGTSSQAPWRAGDIESDAAMLWTRTPRDHQARPAVLALVDGSRARSV